MRHENSSVLELDGKEVSVFTPSKPREKWLRKRTNVKLRVRGFGAAPAALVWAAQTALRVWHRQRVELHCWAVLMVISYLGACKRATLKMCVSKVSS